MYRTMCTFAFEQTLSSIEFIFVNDYSPDNSVSILQSVLNQYPNRSPHTKIVHHEYNRGLAAARNTGRSIAQGEYIIDCDSDDWVERNMYELMYQKAKKTNADIVICDWNEIYATTTKYVSVNPLIITRIASLLFYQEKCMVVCVINW